jgi:alkaline phosphatase D
MQRRDLLTLTAAAAALPACASRSADEPLRRIGFVSCIHQDRPQHLVEHLAVQPFDLFLFGGDNVYSPRPYSREKLRASYGKAAAAAGYTQLRRNVPHLAVWDDNDYDSSDGGAAFAYRREAREEFLAFWNLAADDPRRGREGLYHAQVYGPPGQRVQVVLLDTRSFRSPVRRETLRMPGDGGYVPDPDPARTMLGEVQWRWLEDQLRQPADLRLVVSSIQVMAEGHRWERWGNLPAERDRLVRLIRGTGANGVVLLSGDRHIGAIYRESAGLPYPMYEVTASGFTHPWGGASEPGPNRVGDLFTEQHYGTVEIDWRSGEVRLALRDGRGEPRRSQLLNFNQMKASA